MPGVGNTKLRAKQRGTKNAERRKKGRVPRKGKQNKRKSKKKKQQIWNTWYIIYVCIEIMTFSFMGHRNVKCMQTTHSFVKTYYFMT